MIRDHPETPRGVDTLAASLRLFGIAPGTRYRLLLRNGRVLCALPSGRAEASRILSLYQPQRPVAKLLALALRCFTAMGLHPLVLREWRVPDDAQGEERQDNAPGVMIGSEGHLCDRAVLCLREAGEWRVCKVAYGPNGHTILSHEAVMLRTLSVEFPGIPTVSDFSRRGEATLLRMPYQSGSPWRQADLTPLMTLLASWMNRGDARALGTFAEWSRIESVLKKFSLWNGRLGSIAELKLRPSIRHGDLTRPNLRLSPEGGLLVHDWERGCLEGIPGLDLVHFLVQDRLFRQHMEPSEAVAAVLAALKEAAPSNLLRNLGWGGKEAELMALSFAFNTGSDYFDQTPLIECLG